MGAQRVVEHDDDHVSHATEGSYEWESSASKTMRYSVAIGLGIVAAVLLLTYGPRRDVDLSSHSQTVSVITVSPDGSISHVEVEKTQSTAPRLVTYIVAAFVAVVPVSWVFATRRSRRD